MRSISLEELLEAGCHFGHQVTRQNPKARDFVFEARDNIHIIDLAKTKEGLEEAGQYVRDLAKKGGTMIMLGAKRQAAGIVREEMKRAQDAGVDGFNSVTNRWIGGTLTNFSEVSKNFKRLKQLTDLLQNEYERVKYTKKELSLWDKERQKLESFYGGINDLTKIPDAIFIIDTHLEHLAVREAHATKVTTVGITDTNSDPTLIDYPIPANDDAVGSIQLIVSYIVDSWIEGRKAAKSVEQSAKSEEKNVETSKTEKPAKEPKKEAKEPEVKTQKSPARNAKQRAAGGKVKSTSKKSKANKKEAETSSA